MAFVSSRRNVGFFGLMNNDKITLCYEVPGVNEININEILTLNDEFMSQSAQVTKDCENDLCIENVFICATISDCGHFIAAIDEKKNVLLWEKRDKWNAISRRKLVRKPFKLIFTHNSLAVIVTDRSGDVFSLSVCNPHEKEKLILGHISIILDVVLSQDDRYIVTGDRDNTIRVSHYPNCYNIFTYCFGHKEFISALQFINLPNELLLSSSGDGLLKIWQYKNGSEVFSISLNNLTSCPTSVTDKEIDNSTKVPKQMYFCQKLEVIVIFYYNKSVMDVFQIYDTQKLKHIQLLNFDDELVDAVFERENILFILLSPTTPKIVIYEFKLEYGKFMEILDQNHPVLDLVSKFNLSLSCTKLSPRSQIDLPSLYKAYVTEEGVKEKMYNTVVKKNKMSK